MSTESLRKSSYIVLGEVSNEVFAFIVPWSQDWWSSKQACQLQIIHLFNWEKTQNKTPKSNQLSKMLIQLYEKFF